VIPHVVWRRRRPVEFCDHVKLAAGERDGRLDAVITLRRGGLHATAALRAVGTHVLDVDRRRDDLDVREGELRALRDDASVKRDHGAAVIVQPVAVAALLVRVEVHAAQLPTEKLTFFQRRDKKRKWYGWQVKWHLERGLLDEFNALVELPELVVAPTRVCEDFDAVETHEDVWATDMS
jgi:hypothetical protein